MNRPSVLVVEDDSIVARDIELCLTELGYAVAAIVPRGEDAVEAAMRTRPDVALMDVRLAGHVDGIDAAREIRAQLQTPVVFLTAYSDDATIERAERAEPHGFIVKPFDERDLRSAIELALYRARAERALRESEERYRRLFHNDVAGNFELDVPRRVVTAWNTAFARILGLPDPAGEGVLELDERFTDRATLDGLLARIQRDGKLVEGEFALRRLDGSTRHVITNAAGVFENAQLVRVVGHVTDVTERRLLHEQLFRSQRLEAIGRLAGGIAHDFNNLLTSVTGHAELLLEEGRLAAPERSDVEQIVRAATRARDLVRQLLAVSRRQGRRLRPVDLNAVTREMAAMLARVLGDRVELITELHPAGAWVVADPSQLEQVILNLVVNARDAMPAGGHVAVRTRLLDIDESNALLALAPGPYCVLSVSDTGSGIPDQMLADIPDPFFTTKSENTGLALATMYDIVRQNGGEVNVHGVPGQGTTFEVYLPRTHSESTAPTEAPISRVRAPARTVLVVDDDAQVRTIARRMLAKVGINVQEASSGDAALQAVSEKGMRFDAVITDLDVPGLSGIELVNQLLERDARLLIVIMSGYLADTENLPGQVRFLDKPFTATDLVRVLRER
jgi:PAS domain S-box-containing protein